MASIVARSAPTVLWARSPEVAEEVDKRGRNSRYLGDIPLTDGLRATDSLAQAVADIHDGATVMIGGFGNAGMPSALIDALIAHGARDGIQAGRRHRLVQKRARVAVEQG